MTNMFKTHTGGLPEYLLNIVPKKREHESSYNTRDKEDYITPRCRLQLFRNSFIPEKHIVHVFTYMHLKPFEL